MDILDSFSLRPLSRRLGDLETPVPLVDIDIVDRNSRRWQARCDAAGITNRPHIKTHNRRRSPNTNWRSALMASPGAAQKFLSTHAAVCNIFNVQRHLASARTHRAGCSDCLRSGRQARPDAAQSCRVGEDQCGYGQALSLAAV
jgi:hypothetical protein